MINIANRFNARGCRKCHILTHLGSVNPGVIFIKFVPIRKVASKLVITIRHTPQKWCSLQTDQRAAFLHIIQAEVSIRNPQFEIWRRLPLAFQKGFKNRKRAVDGRRLPFLPRGV